MSRFDEIAKGLLEAIDYENGNKSGAVVHKIEIMDIPDFTAKEIREIRKNANMTQNVFATCIGVTKKAVEAWECGRTHPEGAARRMIGLIKDNPAFAEEVGIIKKIRVGKNLPYQKSKPQLLKVSET